MNTIAAIILAIPVWCFVGWRWRRVHERQRVINRRLGIAQ